MRGFICRCAALLFAALLFTGPVGADALIGSPAFNRMLAENYAPEPTLAFAEQAEAAGETDMAIAALENTLRRHPGTLAAHRRLARLYRSIGNDALADTHQAQAGTAAQPTGATQVWGRATVGFAHDSNPTNAQSSETIRVLDAINNVFLNIPSLDREPDTLVTATLDLGLMHQLSEDALLAAELRVESERYASTDGLDNVTADLTVGPWLGSQADGIFLRPYGRVGGALLDGDLYYATVSGGAELRLALDDNLSAQFDIELQYIDYDGGVTTVIPVNRLDNLRVEATAGLYGQTGGGFGYGIQASAGVSSAKAKPESVVFASLDLFASAQIAAFQRATNMPLTLQIGASADLTRYRAADPVIDPFRARQDIWLGGNGALILGVTDQIDLTIGADYVRRTSNIAAFESDNLRLLSRLGYSF